MSTFEYIKGVTFAPFVGAGKINTKEARASLKALKECTGANYVALVPNILQDYPQAEEIDYTSDATVTDAELKSIIGYIRNDLKMKVCLKPTVNCKNGSWRAFICFFEEDVVCEPKWGNWFKSYTDMQVHYAKIAEETKCEMFCPGCEMVMSEHRETEWRKLISDIRDVYSGILTYNCDKYQEHNVQWWDAVDVISSSGYYPVDTWNKELDRIEKVVKKFNKPFFFAEIGCRSVVNAENEPNKWWTPGDNDFEAQKKWYETCFNAISSRDWVKGVMLWSWSDRLYKPECAENMHNYDIYAKPAEKVVKEFFEKN